MATDRSSEGGRKGKPKAATPSYMDYT